MKLLESGILVGFDKNKTSIDKCGIINPDYEAEYLILNKKNL